MSILWEPFTHEFMQRALLGCALIGFTNGFLGAYVLLRRMALMADALSHSLLPGLALGVIFFGLTPFSLFFGALAAALFVALGAAVISRSSRVKEEVSLGILYTVAFAAGAVLITFAPTRVSLLHYLFGNVLGQGTSDLWIAWSVALVTLPTMAILQRPLFLLLFEPNVARAQGVRVDAISLLATGFVVLAMISALQAVGVVLALGLLIAPAATIYLLSDRFEWLFWGGGLLGAFGSCVGLLLSYWFGLPSGPCIALLLGLLFGAAYLFGPRYGVLPRLWRRKRHFHEESLERWGAERSQSAK
ncbi:MAG: metal ABC transporter permease [Verrucomicrobia bacterium]|nr:metal ABC transporter permease [Verrucomicrobiota bacterium]